MRASKALAGERDWYDLADGLYKAGIPAEAKAVLDDGVAQADDRSEEGCFRRAGPAHQRPEAGDRASLGGVETKAMAAATGALALKIADAYYGYGEYAKAAELYRAALPRAESTPTSSTPASAWRCSAGRPGRGGGGLQVGHRPRAESRRLLAGLARQRALTCLPIAAWEGPEGGGGARRA